MAEYVEKAAFREHLDSVPPFTKDGQRDPKYDFAKTVFLSELAAYPSDDVAPVRHGYWVWDEDGMDWGIGSWRCSECHTRPETWWQGDRSSPYNKSGHYYCPNCGAKMDGGNNG